MNVFNDEYRIISSPLNIFAILQHNTHFELVHKRNLLNTPKKQAWNPSYVARIPTSDSDGFRIVTLQCKIANRLSAHNFLNFLTSSFRFPATFTPPRFLDNTVPFASYKPFNRIFQTVIYLNPLTTSGCQYKLCDHAFLSP